jgi:site-specific DNA-methyltransferase (adenine-specific)
MGVNNTRHTNGSPNGIYGKFNIEHPLGETYGDAGSAARFFYCAKASKSERNIECDELAPSMKNNHPTVKPIALMEYLIKLVSREGATVLDPFMGSGTTGIACIKNNRNFIGSELDKEYYKISSNRIKKNKQLELF